MAVEADVAASTLCLSEWGACVGVRVRISVCGVWCVSVSVCGGRWGGKGGRSSGTLINIINLGWMQGRWWRAALGVAAAPALHSSCVRSAVKLKPANLAVCESYVTLLTPPPDPCCNTY